MPPPRQEFVRSDVEIRAGRRVLRETARTEDSRNPRLVGSLIFAEARIAVDAVDGLFGIGVQFRRELPHGFSQCQYQFGHRCLDNFVEGFFARLKPFATIVAFQVAEKLPSLGRETGEFRFHATKLANTRRGARFQRAVSAFVPTCPLASAGIRKDEKRRPVRYNLSMMLTRRDSAKANETVSDL